MTQYQKQNAAHKVDGYFIPRRGETTEDTFNRARFECVTNLKTDLQDCEGISLLQFLEVTKRKEKP